MDFSICKNGSCNTLCSRSAFKKLNPGHKAKVSVDALTISFNVPNVDKSVVASVLLTDLTVVKALTNCKDENTKKISTFVLYDST